MAINDLTKTYSESFNTLTDAEKQAIRSKALDRPYITDLIGDKVGAQDAFRGLAADLLKTTIDKLKEQKAKEGQFDMLKGLPGFSEIADMGGSISNSILGELGGAAGMAGVDAGALFGGEGGKEGLENQINNMAGLGFLQGSQYNWQKWFDEELSKRYENMKDIKGIDEANRTYELEKKRIYILGKATNLTKRLTNYNKSEDHKVVYYRTCNSQENMDIIEKIILKKLEKYKEKVNRERVILPKLYPITFFKDMIDESIDFIIKPINNTDKTLKL